MNRSPWKDFPRPHSFNSYEEQKGNSVYKTIFWLILSIIGIISYGLLQSGL